MGKGATASPNAAGANTPGGKGLGGAGKAPPGQSMSPFQQGQAMYSQPYMNALQQNQQAYETGATQSPYGPGAGTQAFGSQMPQLGANPYGYSPYSVPGLNANSINQGMNQYYTPIPQQMPQSPYLPGYQFGMYGPPSNPSVGQQMPLYPMQVGQIPSVSGNTTGSTIPGPASGTPITSTGKGTPGWGNTPTG